jgi:predicted dehydrogenase
LTIREPNPLRVGLVGAGMISAYHLIAWSRVPDAEVVAIADPDLSSRAAARAAEFGVPHHYASLDELLDREDALNALDIASPRETHASLVRLAADRGIDVLCQKPLAPTYSEAEVLVRDVDGRIRLMVHENWRFRPYYRQIAEWVRGGSLGTLTFGSMAVRSSGLLPDKDGRYPSLERQPFFRTELRLLVAETLIHHIDVARWLFGPLRLVAARLLRTSDVVAGETVATILLETDTGAPFVIDGNLTCPGYPPANRDRVELIGDRASITMRDDHLQLRGPPREAITYEHSLAYQESFDAAIVHFVHALRTGEPFETGAADNLDTLRLVEAVYQDAHWHG